MLTALFGVAYGLETPFFTQLAAPNVAPKTELYRTWGSGPHGPTIYLSNYSAFQIFRDCVNRVIEIPRFAACVLKSSDNSAVLRRCHPI